jgi:hypothetical protein
MQCHEQASNRWLSKSFDSTKLEDVSIASKVEKCFKQLRFTLRFSFPELSCLFLSSFPPSNDAAISAHLRLTNLYQGLDPDFTILSMKTNTDQLQVQEFSATSYPPS